MAPSPLSFSSAFNYAARRMNWFRRLFSSQPRLAASFDSAAPAPPWAVELADAVQKLTRAQTRIALRVEDVEKKLEGGFSHLGKELTALSPSPLPEQWDELLDSMDLLEEAARSADGRGEGEQAAGLRQVLSRLEKLLAAGKLVRLSETGSAPDGKLFRVVGTETLPHLAEGVVAKVVRAAVLRGGRLLREGEVLTNRSTV